MKGSEREPGGSDRLESWKEIAAYLGRTEKTAQRWEQTEGLPVHRLAHQERGSVYAYRSELDAWRAGRRMPVRMIGDSSWSRWRTPTIARLAATAVVVIAVGVVAVWLYSPEPDRPPVTLAVLPFINQSDDESANYLGSAIAETIVDQLAGATELRIRPFTSSIRASRREDEPSVIGKTLGAEMVVTGRVRATGDTVEIKIDLVDVAANTQVWGTTYSAREAGLGATQESIALAVREQVLKRVYGERFQPSPYEVSSPLSRNPLAVRAFLKGQGFGRNPGRDRIQASIGYFREAVELDPEFVAAHASLAVSHMAIAFFGELPASETMGKAKAYALRTLELAPSMATGHMALASATHYYDFDHEEADRHYRLAIETIQPWPGPLSWYSEFLMEMQRPAAAADMNRRAAEADPAWLEVDVVRGNMDLVSGKADTAIPTYLKALETEPNYGLGRYFLGLAYLETGRGADAIAELRRASQMMGEPPFARAGLAHALARSGMRTEAEQILAEFVRKREAAYYPAFAIAAVHAGLGHAEPAIDWLNRAADERLVGYYTPNVDTMWKPLRAHPQFQQLLRRLRLPDPVAG